MTTTTLPGNGPTVMGSVDTKLQEIDLYRQTPIRYLGNRSIANQFAGYANEIGEAFRAFLPPAVVAATYGIALSYASADAFDKARKQAKNEWGLAEERRKRVGIAAADTFIWQALASVAIPGFTINRLCFFTGKLLQNVKSMPAPLRKWATTFVGLGAIPLIIHPIDHAVDVGMDSTIRKLYQDA